MDPLDYDTPSLSRSSLDRISALRARPLASPSGRARPVLPWLISAVLLAFALGLIANPWFETRIRTHLPGFAASTLPTVSDLEAERAATLGLEKRVAKLETQPVKVARAPALVGASPPDEGVGELSKRLATANDRIDAVGTQVAMLGARVDASAVAAQTTIATVAHDAQSVQSVLLLGMTRRALEKGERLVAAVPGADAALQARFAASHAAPLAAVLALGNAPVTPRSLGRDLVLLTPRLTGGDTADADWWDRLTSSLATIVRVRESGGAAVDPVDRVATAQAALAIGNVDDAVLQIAALPIDKRRLAYSWLASAARLRIGMRALSGLEAASLAPPTPPAPAPTITNATH